MLRESTAKRAAVDPDPTPPLPQPIPVAPAEPQPAPVAQTRTPEASTRSVQNVLLSLGGVLSAAAIIVFTAVAWATFGAPGRAGILTVITIGLMILPLWIVRRGLTATAETVSGLAILMVPCDAMALYLLRLFPTSTTEPVMEEPATHDFGGTITTALTSGIHTPGIGAGLLVITGIAVAYRMLTRMIVPGYAVAVLGVFTLAVAALQSSVALGTGLLLGSAAIQAFAATLFGRHPARRGRTAGRVLVQTCGALAAMTLLAAALYSVGSTKPGYTLLAVTALAAVLLAVTQRLPSTWRPGPLWTVRITVAASAFVAVALALIVAGRWLLLPLPAWSATLDVPDWPLDPRFPFGWRLTATVVILTVVVAALLPYDRWAAAMSANGAPEDLPEPGRPATASATSTTDVDGTTASAQANAPHSATVDANGATATATSRADVPHSATADHASAPTGTGQPTSAAAATTSPDPSTTARPAATLAGGVLALLTVAPALGWSWRASALLLTAAAIAIVAGALAVKQRRLSRALLISAIPVGLNAIVLSLGGDATTLTVLLAACGCLAILAPLACLRGQLAPGGALAGTALWTLMAALPVACHLLGLAPSHVAALSGILAATAALLGSLLLTHRANAYFRLFVSWTLFGLLGGIATTALTAAIIAGSRPVPLFVAIAAFAALPILLAIAVRLENTVDFHGPPDDTEAEPNLRRVRRLCTGLATIALLATLGAYVSMWAPADTLPGYVILALVAAMVTRVLPRRYGDGPDVGSWTVAGIACGFAAAAALSTIPALFGLTPTLPWLDWRTPALLGVVAVASLLLLPSAWRTATATTAATLGLLSAPVAWTVPWWSGPTLFTVLAVAYGLWAVFSPKPKPPQQSTNRADAESTGSLAFAASASSRTEAEPPGPHATAAEPSAEPRDRAAGTGETWSFPPVATVWARGLAAFAFAAYGLAAAALHANAPSPTARYSLTATLAAALVSACIVIAVLAYRRQRVVGGLAVASGLILLPGTVVMAGLAMHARTEPIQLGAMAAACFGLLVAAGLRFGAVGYLGWATLVVPPVAVACARAGVPSHQSGMYIAVAGLVGVGAAMLMLPNRRAAMIRTGLSGIAILSTMFKVLPLSIATMTLPYRWLGSVWTETPLTTMDGLVPSGSVPRFLVDATGWDLAILAVGVTTVALAILGLTGRGWGIGATFVALAIALPTVPVVFDLPWPSLPFAALAIAVAAYVLSTHVKLPASQLSILTIVAVICCGTGLTGSLASRGATLAALTVLSIGTLTGGLLGASTARRATGWLLSSATVTGLVTATAFAADLPTGRLPYGIVAVAALFLALASARTPLTGPATWAAEASGHLVALAAVATATAVSVKTVATTISTPAIVLVIYGALLGLLAVRAAPDDDADRLLTSKRWYTAGSITAAFAAYWLLLADARVSVIEVYTVPFALATLLAGWLELRRRPTLSSWTAYGPGLCLLLLPPLAQILLTEDEPLRRLGLGVASIAILLLGTRQRFQAPVVVATIMLVVQTGYEITLLWTLVPSWLPLAIGGVLLLTLGATFEKRRRDLRRLAGAITDMR